MLCEFILKSKFLSTQGLIPINSTIIVSIVRLWALARYGSSTNPIYENMLSGIFSPLELNVGIICMCLPAFRRCVARFLPACFVSTLGNSNPKYKYREYEEGTPNSHLTLGKRSGRRAKADTLGGSLFETTIMKTVDTRVEEILSDEDEVRLMELRNNGQRPEAAESAGEISMSQKPESVYRAQHKNTLPKDW